jgi:hypothetical protein
MSMCRFPWPWSYRRSSSRPANHCAYTEPRWCCLSLCPNISSRWFSPTFHTMAATAPALDQENLPPPITTKYTVFSRRQRWYIVFLIAAAGWFSTLSSFIYYPVLAVLADDLHTSVARINLTVTAYLAISGVAPSIAGDAADMFGRRPVYIITLSLYLCANIGLAIQNSFVALLLCRILQSAGISGRCISHE